MPLDSEANLGREVRRKPLTDDGLPIPEPDSIDIGQVELPRPALRLCGMIDGARTRVRSAFGLLVRTSLQPVWVGRRHSNSNPANVRERVLTIVGIAAETGPTVQW